MDSRFDSGSERVNKLVYSSLTQQDKSSSSVKLPNIEKKSPGGGDDDSERFHAKNWKALSKKEIQKLPPQQRSKYLAVRNTSFSFTS